MVNALIYTDKGGGAIGLHFVRVGACVRGTLGHDDEPAIVENNPASVAQFPGPGAHIGVLEATGADHIMGAFRDADRVDE